VQKDDALTQNKAHAQSTREVRKSAFLEEYINMMFFLTEGAKLADRNV
jgi:hypothetical protein